MRRFRLVSWCAAAWVAGCSSEPASTPELDAGATPRADVSETGTSPIDASRDVGVGPCTTCADATPTPFDAQGTPKIMDAAGTDRVDAATRADAAPRLDATTQVDAHEGPAGYPDGPYGTEVGDTFPYLMWQGYVSDNPDAAVATMGAFTAYSSDAMRTSGRTVALLHVSDFDCPGCQHAARTMATGAAGIERAGGLVMEVLISHGFFSPATRDYLDAWVKTYDFSMTSVIDAPGHELATLNAMGIRETALVIELSTMHVVFRKTGDLAGIDPPSLDDAFAEMYARLRD